jgi:hypothetical protein
MRERLAGVQVPADQRPGHAEHLQIHFQERQIPHDFPRAQGALEEGAARGVLGARGTFSQKPLAQFRVPLRSAAGRQRQQPPQGGRQHPQTHHPQLLHQPQAGHRRQHVARPRHRPYNGQKISLLIY